MQKLAIGISGLGLVIILVAVIVGWIVVPNVIDDKIVEEVRLIKGSETWDKWVDIPIPISLSFYIFHITNPDDVEAGKPPVFEEKGPYVYSQHKYKVDLTQNDKENPDHTVQYREMKDYYFNQTLSKDNKETDRVNVINIAFVAVVAGVKSEAAALAPFIANAVLGSETLVKRDVVVGDLLFKGFDVSLYTESFIGGLLPKEFSGGRFGLYKGENGSRSEIYDVYTGVGNSADFGQIRTYAGSNQLGFWRPNTVCDTVRGTDGSVYAPFFTKDRVIDVFSTDICRSLKLEYDSDMEHKGIKGYSFRVTKWELEDPRKNKANQCYCHATYLDECPRGGAMPLSGCRDGAPIVMSTPYFLDGDEKYHEDSGLGPSNREKHVTHIDVEPNTGLVLVAHKRIQVNVDLQVDNSIKQYTNLTKSFYFPLLWADESAELDDVNVDDLKGKLLTPKKIVDISKWAILGVGIAVVVAGVALYIIRR